MLIRPNVFLGLLTLLLVEALIAGIYPVGHIIGTLYRTVRLAEFVAMLWLLSPWSNRRDLLLVKCQLGSLGVVLGSVLLGLLVSPSRALDQGRLSGEFWPITPVQVADFAAVALGLVVVLWFCGEAARAPHPGRRRGARGHAAPDPHQDRGDRLDGGPPRGRPEHVRGQGAGAQAVRRPWSSRCRSRSSRSPAS